MPKEIVRKTTIRPHWSPFLPFHDHEYIEYGKPFHDHMYTEDGKLYRSILYLKVRIYNNDWEFTMKSMQGWKSPLRWAPRVAYSGKAVITWVPKRPVPWVPSDLYEKILNSQNQSK